MIPLNSGARRALVVDDDPAVVQFASDVLVAQGWNVQCGSSGDQALAKAHTFRPEMILLGVNIPEQSGWLVCAKLKLVGPAPRVILVFGPAGPPYWQSAELVGADDAIHTPFSADELLRIVDQFAPTA